MVSRLLIAVLGAAALTIPARAADLDAAIGKKLFQRQWVTASSGAVNGGLGPLYDARSCSACHENAGPGKVGALVPGFGMAVRLGTAEGTGDPVYGHQLQAAAVPGFLPEGRTRIEFNEKGGMRIASLAIDALNYGPLKAQTSLRRAPSLHGLAALAAIPESEILKRESSGPGISGRASFVVNEKGERALGRFGWKASEADLKAQIGLAFARDIGLSSRTASLASGDCTTAQGACFAAAARDTPEIPDALIELIAAYMTSLPLPARVRDAKGEKLFTGIGCGACHVSLTTKEGGMLHAYTDLLLHDMGEGLSDGAAEGAASPREWRTAPLWTLSQQLKAGGLLHDGRARDVREAIAWHGGEAEDASTRFAALAESDKAALLAFLNRL